MRKGQFAPIVHANGYFDALISSRDLLGLEPQTDDSRS
jgi:hypothetical protein